MSKFSMLGAGGLEGLFAPALLPVTDRMVLSVPVYGYRFVGLTSTTDTTSGLAAVLQITPEFMILLYKDTPFTFMGSFEEFRDSRASVIRLINETGAEASLDSRVFTELPGDIYTSARDGWDEAFFLNLTFRCGAAMAPINKSKILDEARRLERDLIDATARFRNHSPLTERYPYALRQPVASEGEEDRGVAWAAGMTP